MTRNNRASCQPLLLHPHRIVPTHVRFGRVHARRLDMLEPIPRTVEPAPEIEISQDRLAFDGLVTGARGQRLKVRLADQGREKTRLTQQSGQRGNILPQFRAQRPSPVLRGHQSRQDARA